MFELPEAKRIRRNEIVSPSSSTRSSPEIIPADDEEAHAKLGQLLAFEVTATNTEQHPKTNHDDTQQPESKDEIDDEEEFEFRLFSAPKPAASTTTTIQDANQAKEKSEIRTQKLKIRLRSPTPVDAQPGDGRFIVPFRGWRYYFTKPELMQVSARDAEEKARIEAEELMRRREYEDIAITGGEVLDWAKNMDTAGCHLPWRVVRLDRKYHRVPKALFREVERTTTEISRKEGDKKKSKPGKKRRIILRTRAAAKAAEKAKAEATSNMTEAEKRNKKNRERKIKRRQKEREKKAAMAAATTGGTEATPGDGESSD